MADATAPTTWVSSLGNVFTSQSGGALAPRSDAGPMTTSSFGSSAVKAATTATTSTIGSREDKNSMMAAFLDLDLELTANGSVVAAASEGSAAKALLAKKDEEKAREEATAALHLARKQLHDRQQQQSRAKPTGAALLQAIDAFAGEVEQSETLSRKVLGTQNRRARQKADKARERADASGRGGRSQRDAKRMLRKEKYRHVY
ncbi:hypothetical protein PINS_up010030 [Pythium insidiosum]|nr:hypothetical protein PINS_up010030 [Pythium insidiosum]